MHAKPSPASPMNINQLPRHGMNLVYNVCSIVCCPVEMALRPQYGSRYFPPIILMFSAAMMIRYPSSRRSPTPSRSMLPFMRFRGMPACSASPHSAGCFFLGAFAHGLRIWRRMIHMDREEHSLYEGPPLPIFRLFPGTFWMVRILYEPAFVFALALVLPNFFVLQSSAAHYLCRRRHARDEEYAPGTCSGSSCAASWTCAIPGRSSPSSWITGTEDELATVHLASLPKNIPDDVRVTRPHTLRACSAQGGDQ